MSEEINYFTCGYCIYAQMVDPPEGSDYTHKRGYCIFEPPKVFPMPRPKKSKLAAMGQQPDMEMTPYMMRPIVEDYEGMCGRGVLTPEAMDALGVGQEKKQSCKGGCGGCKDEGAKCEC
jgi:hypothetical protein